MANNLAQVIAVTGLAGCFPGAGAIESLGRGQGGDAPAPAGPGGSAPGQDLAPEAARRLFLDSAAVAIGHAGCAGRSESEHSGLFVGAQDPSAGGEEGDRLARELARELGLGGPAVAVPLPPSSPSSPALAAIERACQSLRRAECDLALAGAVPLAGGELGAVVLERLSDALVNGDRALAVIRGSAVDAGCFEAAPSPAPRRLDAGGESGGEPVRERPALGNEYVPPGNRLEAAIAGVWQEHLGIDRVGVQDNFFELGGNSLVGTQIIARLREWLQQEIPTVSLYEGPTVSALSRVLLQGGGGGSSRGYDAVRERGERRRRKLQRLTQEASQGPAE